MSQEQYQQELAAAQQEYGAEDYGNEGQDVKYAEEDYILSDAEQIQ